MSVYKRPGRATYSYDFRFRGQRFSGTTECSSKRDAERFEEEVRRKAKANVIDTTKPLTMADAAALYWSEVGQHHADPKATLRILGWLQDNIGKATLISDISDATVARLVAKKRGETRGRKAGGGTVQVRLSHATVNRSMTEPLRGLLARAADVWGAQVQKIDWKRHKLKEPQERVREASLEEEEAIVAAMPEDYRPALAFALMTGCRRAEIVGLTWQNVDFFNREIRVLGKGDRSRTIPMTEDMHALLWSLKDHHPEAVFTYVAKNPAGGRLRGARYPITVNGFQTVWNRHGRGLLADFRFHDTRHTAATRIVRVTGNLKMAQHLLGHTSVTTTARYAHVTHDDLRQGMEAAARAKSATQSATDAPAPADNKLKSKGK